MHRILALVILIVAAFPAWAGGELGDDGLHKQDWFLNSFLEMPDDLAEAADEGKLLMVIVEQAGCPYCRELHNVNFARTEITDYIQENFVVVQLDLWGSREVLDFDGEPMEERDLARKWGVNFTPTTLVFTMEDSAPESFFDAEAFRMPGLLKPFHYLSSLEYVVSGEYKEQPFQRFLQDKFEDLHSKGIEPDVW